MTALPIIETERLILRGHRLGDMDQRSTIISDPAVMEFIGGIQDHPDNVERLYRYAGMWALCGRGPFAVEERATGRLVGEAGLADFPREMGANFDGEPEAMWLLGREAQGKGYAFEAMRAAIDWHDHAFGRRRLVAIIAPGNRRSLALSRRLGFTGFDRRNYRDHDVTLLERRV